MQLPEGMMVVDLESDDIPLEGLQIEDTIVQTSDSGCTRTIVGPEDCAI